MTSYAYELLKESDRRPTIGLVVLQTDETLEPDIDRYFPPSAADVYVSRVPNASEVNQETLADMANLRSIQNFNGRRQVIGFVRSPEFKT